MFILAMHVLFHDVAQRLNDPTHEKTNQGINLHEILYAHDTLLIAKDPKSATKLLNINEEDSDYQHLKLNRGKCNYIAYNLRQTANIILKHGEQLQATNEAKYLGTTVGETVDP